MNSGVSNSIFRPVPVRYEPEIPWIDIAEVQGQFAHRHFDTSHPIIQGTIESDLPALSAGVRRLLRLEAPSDS